MARHFIRADQTLLKYLNPTNPAEISFLGSTAGAALPDQSGTDNIEEGSQNLQTNNTESYERYCKYLYILG
jgi:hypothetical protein